MLQLIWSKPLLLVFIGVSIMFFLVKYKHFFYANGFIVACYSAFLCILNVSALGIAWYNGTFDNQIGWSALIHPYYRYLIGVFVLFFTFISFNFLVKVRRNIKFQVFGFACLAILLLLESYFIITFDDTPFSIERFQDIILIRIPSQTIYFVVVLLGLDWLMVKTKLLPELKEKSTDLTYGALLDEDNK